MEQKNNKNPKLFGVEELENVSEKHLKKSQMNGLMMSIKIKLKREHLTIEKINLIKF